jgi:ankyrin repeat protein
MHDLKVARPPSPTNPLIIYLSMYSTFLFLHSSKMSILFFPTELLQHIANEIESLQTLRALSCVNQRFYAIFNPVLYRQDARNSSSAPGSIAIAWAAEHGNLDLLKKALSYGAELLSPSPLQKRRRLGPALGKRTCMMGGWHQLLKKNRPDHPLCVAVKKGHRDITEFLIVDQGCNINMQTQRAFPLLSLAVLYGHIHLIKFLLKLGASSQQVDARFGGFKRSPIRTAVMQGSEVAMKLLLDPELHPDCRPSVKQMQDALDFALHSEEEDYDNKENIIHLLLDSSLLDGNGGFDFYFRNIQRSTEPTTPLLWAVEQDDLRYLARFLNAGADPNYEPDFIPWRTALVRAVRLQNEEMVKLLVTKTDRKRRTLALAWSIKLWSPDDENGRCIPRILMENGTLPEFEPNDGRFLRGERAGENFDGCTFGLESPEEVTDEPLVLAVHSGHIEMVRLLVEYGADVNIRFYDILEKLGEVSEALSLATKLGHMEIAQFLRDHGAVERDYMAELAREFAGWSYTRPSESTYPRLQARDDFFVPIPE